MKINTVNADSAPQAAGGYSQAVAVSGAERLLFISGQIPETAAGDVPADFSEQARLVWRNVFAQLRAAEMTVANLVKVTIGRPMCGRQASESRLWTTMKAPTTWNFGTDLLPRVLGAEASASHRLRIQGTNPP